MDRRVFEDRRRIGTVKAAVNMYGERILENTSSLKKSPFDIPQEPSSRAKELHKAKRDVVKYNERRKASESSKARAETKLLEAKKTVKELALQIEESNLKVKEKVGDMDKIKKLNKQKDQALTVVSPESHQYGELMRDLETAKQDLSKLKLDMVGVLEEKMQAERELEESSSKLQSNLSSLESLRWKIDEVNEEQVLVEIAKIEAMKELGETEAEKSKKAGEFAAKIDGRKKEINGVREEIDSSKELESKLAVTLADISTLQNELKGVREIKTKVRSDSFDQLEGSDSIQSIMEELETAKKELTSIKEEGFQFMTSMDIIRNELNHVNEETTRLQKLEAKASLTVQNLNSKLLRAKSKQESAAATAEKAKSVVSNLSMALEQLKTEVEVARKEKELVAEQTATIKAEVQKTESEIDLTEEKLQAAMQELESVKAAEALALERLRNFSENFMRTRAAASQQGSSITISKFEYEYLSGRANGAEEIADKKVAAAQAWIEALKTSEKEILMKMDMAGREIKDMRMEEEKEAYRAARSLSAKKVVEGELLNWREIREGNTEADKLQVARPRKAGRGNGILTQSKRAKFRKSASPGVRLTPRSASLAIRRKKKGIANLAKLFTGKRLDGKPS